MNHPSRLLTLAGLACLCGLTLPGCFRLRPVADSTRHFTLSAPAPAPDPAPAETAAPGPALGLALVSFPSHLENSRLAQRTSDFEIQYLDWLLWAEPLDRGFLRLLGLNLGRSLHAEKLLTGEWRREAVDLELYLEIIRFEPDDRGLVTLEAEWRFARPGRGETLRSGTSRLQKQGPPLSSDPAGTVACLSAVLDEFGRALAEAVSTLPRPQD